MPLSTNSHFNITNIDTIKLVLGQSGQLEGNGAFSLLCSLKRGSLNIYEPDVWKASIGDGKQTWKLLDPLNIQDKLLLGIALFVFTCLELLHSLGMLFGCPGWFFGQRRPPLEFPCFFLFFFLLSSPLDEKSKIPPETWLVRMSMWNLPFPVPSFYVKWQGCIFVSLAVLTKLHGWISFIWTIQQALNKNSPEAIPSFSHKAISIRRPTKTWTKPVKPDK